MSERPFAVGDRVFVAGDRGCSLAEVVCALSRGEFPPLALAPAFGFVRRMLCDWRVDFLVSLAYYVGGERVCVFALRRPCGVWLDVGGRELLLRRLPALVLDGAQLS